MTNPNEWDVLMVSSDVAVFEPTTSPAFTTRLGVANVGPLLGC
jgi:hypothetical protein